MRAILWHQLGNSDADAAALVSTLVRRCGADWVRRLAAWVLLPIELTGLTIILTMMHSTLPWLALALYLAVLWLCVRLWSNIVVIVAPVSCHPLILQHYYICRWQLSSSARFGTWATSY